MTREEIIECYAEAVYSTGLAAAAGNENAMRDYELLKAGFDALRTPTREQVEKMRGEWIDIDGEKVPVDKYGQPYGWAQCSACKRYLTASAEHPCTGHFCPNCGAPMTDEAVDMTMKRLEEMRNDQ